MMSDKTPREGRGRTKILSPSPQSRPFKRGIWISLIIHTLCPMLQPAGGGSKFRRERPNIPTITEKKF